MARKQKLTLSPRFLKSYLPEIERIDILPNNVAFVLYNVFSQEQCRWLIEYFEKSANVKHVSDDGYNRNYRDCFRLIVEAPALAQFMMDRIRPYLEEELVVNNDDRKILEHGLTANPTTFGTWQPDRLNSRYRFCKYIPGGHFAAHYDGDTVESPECRSFKTCMLYTNSVDGGGMTNFIDDKSKYFSGKKTVGKMDKATKLCEKDGDDIWYSLKPEAGMVLIFNHHLFHNGSELEAGSKYIVRTDIMYKKN